MLMHSQLFTVRLGNNSVYPAELCTIESGQIYKKRLSQADQTAFLKLSQQGPRERLKEIRSAVSGPVISMRFTKENSAKVRFRTNN